MTNPFRLWREEHGLTRNQMAVLLEINVSQVQMVEVGTSNRPFKSFVSAFAKVAGADLADGLVSQYASWREEQRAQILAKMNAKEEDS